MSEIALLGKKIGMTREFYKSGQLVPVTVLKVEKARVIQVIEAVMDKSAEGQNAGNITVSKDAIIESVAEKILSQDKSVNVIDKKNKVIGSVKPSKIIQTVFGQGKEKK